MQCIVGSKKGHAVRRRSNRPMRGSSKSMRGFRGHQGTGYTIQNSGGSGFRGHHKKLRVRNRVPKNRGDGLMGVFSQGWASTNRAICPTLSVATVATSPSGKDRQWRNGADLVGSHNLFFRNVLQTETSSVPSANRPGFRGRMSTLRFCDLSGLTWRHIACPLLPPREE